MPRIFDNIELKLLPTLRETLQGAKRADFCVGYFNLRGWRQIDSLIEQFSGDSASCCRLLVGMQRLPRDEVHASLSLGAGNPGIDRGEAARLKKRIAQEFREQLMMGAPTNDDEAGLRRLSIQLKTKKLFVKLFLRHTLHAKLYLIHRSDPNLPSVGFLGSSNLTLSGLRYQGELNVDVLDHDAAQKLQHWFEDRWADQFCLDISEELATLIDESWAREVQPSPYQIYLKIAYHLSQEARTGLSEYRVPRELRDRLFEFQSAAVKIAAHHVNKRGGVLVGDVVGLGKTLVGTALAKILQEDSFLETLIICPKNLVSMWQDYVREYRLYAEVLSLSRVQTELPQLRRYRVVLIDESHNLRNREGRRYRAIQEYIAINESKCILLTATPYNKTYLDLSAQLRLFLPEDKNLGIRPERLLNELGGELEFNRRHQAAARSLSAFELSDHTDDWRELMKLYMVRRTRSFIKNNYTQTDKWGRQYLEADGMRSYFPNRVPKTARFNIGSPETDPYARLYSDDVVRVINSLTLPRYGLGNYENSRTKQRPNEAEQKILDGLSRAGRRLMGFCRTNLFKRLESSGMAFIQSLERHILRNYIYLHAIENDLKIPIGTQDAELLDTRNGDEDSDSVAIALLDPELDDEVEVAGLDEDTFLPSEKEYRLRAAEVYKEYVSRYARRFKWIHPGLFTKQLAQNLLADARALLEVLNQCGGWDTGQDSKLNTLVHLLEEFSAEKVLVFTQFADTARYLAQALKVRGVINAEAVTGSSADPTQTAWRFSPQSNNKRDHISPDTELRVLIATDVLSEGQNLQDCAIVVNYDLPWAIIRLIQRAGRVDRIGQKAENILCYSFLPAEGVDRLINLRGRLQQRLQENAEVLGTDEEFFEDLSDQVILDLYNEKSGILDGEEDNEVDLTSEAFQIWKNATEHNPALKKAVEDMPNVVYSTRAHAATPTQPNGVMLYMRTAEGNDALAWVDCEGHSVTQSQLAILRMAACEPDTPTIGRGAQHHELVQKGVEFIVAEEKSVGGQLGRSSGARFRTYERLKRYAQQIQGTLFESVDLLKVIDEIYRYPFRQSAVDVLNRQLKSGIDDAQLAELAIALRIDDRLCLVHEDEQPREPQIICSLGLF